MPYSSYACSSLPSIVISFLFYYFVHSSCCTPVLPATRCLVLKINETAILRSKLKDYQKLHGSFLVCSLKKEQHVISNR
ncbi:hypothetical protein E4T79_02470 [Streptococcus sp. LYSM12]|nr:hypothetical protein E4T79_02470 [Streptococcus sp. LYSM12]